MADISKIKLPSGTEYNIKDYRIPGVDSTPTSGSNNIVTSGGIKSAIDTAIGSVYRVKGTQATYADLPSSGNVPGDVWNVTAAYGNYPPGTNWVWTGSAWDALGGAIDLSGYLPLTGGTVTGRTDFNDDVEINDSLTVTGSTRFQGDLLVGGWNDGTPTQSNGSLRVNGTFYSHGNGEVTGTFDTGNLDVHGAADVSGSLSIGSQAVIGNHLEVSNGGITVSGTSYFNGTLDASGESIKGGDLTISGTSRTQGDLVTSKIKPSTTGVSDIGNDAKFYRNLYIRDVFVGDPNGYYSLPTVVENNELVVSAALNDLNDRMIDVEEQEWVTTEQYSVIDSVVRDTYTKSEIDTMLSNIGGGGSGSGSGGSGEQAVTSVTVSGSGNAVTNATFSNKALTLTKGNISTPGTLTTTSTTALSTASNEALSGNINLHKIAKTGTYSDLIGKPTIPSAPGTLNTTATTAQSTNASEALSGSVTLHKVAKTGSYNDLLNKPTIPDTSNLLSKNGGTMNGANLTFEDFEGFSSSLNQTSLEFENDYSNYLVRIDSSFPGIKVSGNASTNNSYTIYKDHCIVQRNNNTPTTINIPSSAGTLALTSDIPVIILDWDNDGVLNFPGVDPAEIPNDCILVLTGDGFNSYLDNKNIVTIQDDGEGGYNHYYGIVNYYSHNINDNTSYISLGLAIPYYGKLYDAILYFDDSNSDFEYTGEESTEYLSQWDKETSISSSSSSYDNQIPTIGAVKSYVSSAAPSAVTESTVSGWGFTKNTGTLTGVSFNGTSATVTNGVAAITTDSFVTKGGQTNMTAGAAIVFPNAIPIGETEPTRISGIHTDGFSIEDADGSQSAVTLDGFEVGNDSTGFTSYEKGQIINTVIGDSTVEYTLTLPTSSGTLALTSQIPSAPGTLNTTATTAQSASASESLSGSITLHKVAKTGSYDDLNNKPTIPSTLDDIADGSTRKLSNYVPKSGGVMANNAELTFYDSNRDYITTINHKKIMVENDAQYYAITLDSDVPKVSVDNGSTITTLLANSITYKDNNLNTYTYSFPAANGILALASQIPSAPGTLITNATTAQTASSGEAMSGSITLHKVAKTGTYSDLIGTPTIPTVNNSTISIQKGGTAVDSFTTNASSAKTINIPNELPSYSSSDSGKILSVNSSGQLVWITPAQIYSGSGTPSNNTGNNGDVYLQTSVS